MPPAAIAAASKKSGRGVQYKIPAAVMSVKAEPLNNSDKAKHFTQAFAMVLILHGKSDNAHIMKSTVIFAPNEKKKPGTSHNPMQAYAAPNNEAISLLAVKDLHFRQDSVSII